jgi:ornithine cyclodeaminase/alanine dehydrogenase-like protein (mu-crystallin family)
MLSYVHIPRVNHVTLSRVWHGTYAQRTLLRAMATTSSIVHLFALIALDELGPLRTAAPDTFASQYLAPRQARTPIITGSGLAGHYYLQGMRLVAMSSSLHNIDCNW